MWECTATYFGSTDALLFQRWTIAYINPHDSLDKLVKRLRGGNNYDVSNFKIIYKYFFKKYPNMSKKDFKLIITKGIYPYEYMDSFDKFNEQQLPPIEKFYSSINDETISKNDYKHALKSMENIQY